MCTRISFQRCQIGELRGTRNAFLVLLCIGAKSLTHDTHEMMHMDTRPTHLSVQVVRCKRGCMHTV